MSEIRTKFTKLGQELIRLVQAGKTVFLSAYCIGYGFEDKQQYLVLSTKYDLLPIEQMLRELAYACLGKVFIFAQYDTVRLEKPKKVGPDFAKLVVQ